MKPAPGEQQESARAASSGHALAEDSLAPVLHLGDSHRFASIALAACGALLIHGSAAARAATALYDVGDYARGVRTHIVDQLRLRYDIDVDQPEPEPKPEPEPEPEPEAEPEPAPTQPLPPDFPEPPLATSEPPPAPAAAEAAKVLTQEPDPDEPLDLTDQGFISGSGTRFAGGVTAADGTSKSAVRNRSAKSDGVPGGTGTKPGTAIVKRVPEPDLSTMPKPVGGAWDCPFPPEADVEQVNYARVTLIVVVDPGGVAKSATVLSDPGFGFGSAARRCALTKRYTVGTDKRGNPVAKTTPPINVTFRR